MTSHAVGGLAGSRRTLLMQQQAAGGRHDRRLESMTSYKKSGSSIDAYVLEEQSCQISSKCDLKRQSVSLFLKNVAPTTNKNNKIWDQFLRSKHYNRCKFTL